MEKIMKTTWIKKKTGTVKKAMKNNMQILMLMISDLDNFKGIYFNDDPNRKYQCPETGAHFEYK